ncbi:RDD family protein [Solihabitans fulvus]|uniref:RDD family protein n=2 Tax=Solihabitans fulvus TaxID=1892852 RepID=A0A5B2X6P2_9PSEU|nr:RDD family protein [Solihabitans fulvus]
MARAREDVTRVLGEPTGKRLRAFDDGGLYVEPGWPQFWAWLIDFFVVVAAVAGTAGAYYAAHRYDFNAAGRATGIGILLVVVAPLVYGLFYGNGRAIGGLLAGTRLVRKKDGSRIGLAKAGWAMLIRTIGFVILVLGALAGDSSGVEEVRVSIDVRATALLHNAGFRSLPR